MITRKAELREIVLNIIFQRVQVFDPFQFGNLTAGVAEVLSQRSGNLPNPSNYPSERRLKDCDEVIVREIFWDLFIQRVITLGADAANADFPHFRLHSEAADALKA
jgi:hypothetical protein